MEPCEDLKVQLNLKTYEYFGTACIVRNGTTIMVQQAPNAISKGSQELWSITLLNKFVFTVCYPNSNVGMFKLEKLTFRFDISNSDNLSGTVFKAFRDAMDYFCANDFEFYGAVKRAR